MSKIIKNHFQNIINTLNKTKIDIKIIMKISEKLISSIKSKKKFLFTEMVVHLQTAHILLVS